MIKVYITISFCPLKMLVLSKYKFTFNELSIFQISGKNTNQLWHFITTNE